MRSIDLLMAAQTNLAKGFLFVVTDIPGFDLSISLEAPGMDVKAPTWSLFMWLKNNLPYTHINWTREVRLLTDRESEQTKIVVSLDRDDTDKAATMVIHLAAGYLASLFAEQGRDVVLLREGQRFAPLAFQHTNHGTCMSMVLPDSLVLRRPPHLSGNGGDLSTATCQFVAQVLTAALAPYEIDRVSVYVNDDSQTIVKVVFYTGDTKETIVKDIQRVTLEVLGHHVLIEGFDHLPTDLVLGITR